MKGLLLKDFYMAAKYCRSFLAIVIVFIAVTFFGDNNIFFIIYPTMVAGLLPMTLISYDERDKWDQCSGVLPYSKAQLVSAKYITGLLFGACVYLILIVVYAARMANRGTFILDELIFIGVALFVLGIVGPTLMLPFVFKYGVAKGRIAFYVLVGLFAAIGTAWMRIDVYRALSLWINERVLIAAVGAAVLLYLLSWRLSILFYKKRELN